jgi:adenylate cyclase
VHVRELYRRLRSAGVQAGDSEDLRLKKEVLLFACGLMIAASAIWLALYWWLHYSFSASLPLGFQLASAATLLYYLYTLNFEVFRAVQLGLWLFVPFVVQWSIGNFVSASGVTLWALLAPVGAVLLYSARESMPWMFAYVFLMLVTGYVDYELASMPPRPPIVPLSTSVAFFALNFATTSLIVYALLRYAFVERERSRARLEEAQAQSERLLLNILPGPVAERLKRSETAIADGFENVTVMFADIVGFTRFAGAMAPAEIFALLNRLFSRFDELTERSGVEKIKTIGDAYMVAGGLGRGTAEHTRAIVELALALQETVTKEFSVEDVPLRLRVGIATGPVVAGVVGTQKFIYDLWGDTVNLASRITDECPVGAIQVDEATCDRLRGSFEFLPPKTLDLRGKGQTRAYLLAGSSGV